MKTKDYLKILRDDIHSVVFATTDSKHLPVTRVIDIMLTDDDSLYFITAKGKAFYNQLMDNKFVALSGMTGGKGSMSKKAVSIRGRVECIGKNKLDEVFKENPYMAEIYPQKESRTALEVFRLYEGEGEFFDLSAKPIVRESFYLGKYKSEDKQGLYYITDKCIGCKMCVSKCPQNCIDVSGVPFAIVQKNCLHCGNCKEVCSFCAVENL